MRISELAKKSNLPLSTIRYYIKQGLLLPKKVNGQHRFDDGDVQELYYINMWKNMGFSIQEIEHLTSLKRLSNWVAIEDYMHYYNILEVRRQSFYSDIKRINMQLKMLDDEMLSLRQNELYNWEKAKHESHGFPISCLGLLECPHCHKPLYLKDAQMDYQYIDNCTLACECGYHAAVENGILVCEGNPFDNHEKPDTLRAKYKMLSQELSVLFQRTSNWLFSFLMQGAGARVILETQLNSFFFLYPYLKSLHKEDTLILVDRFPELLNMYKRNIERMDLDLTIVYMVNGSGDLPLRHGTVDFLIDYLSTNCHNLFSNTPYLPRFRPFLKRGGAVLGAYYYLENAPHSLRALRNAYPYNHPENFNAGFYKKSAAGFAVTQTNRMGCVHDCGGCLSFDFHQTGEKLCVDCYVLAPKDAQG